MPKGEYEETTDFYENIDSFDGFGYLRDFNFDGFDLWSGLVFSDS